MRKLSIVLVGLGAILLVGILLITRLNGTNSPAKANQQTVTATKPASVQRPNTHKRTIVIYMSRTGHTKTVAEAIHKQVGGDLYQLKTKEKYPDSYQKMLTRARSEQNQHARPALAGQLPNLDHYQNIFLGYPIWWNKNPMAINTFLSHYQRFNGKTIFPFTTSGSSGLGASIPQLEQHAKGATFRHGLAVTDDQMNQTSGLVSQWLKKNGLSTQ